MEVFIHLNEYFFHKLGTHLKKLIFSGPKIVPRDSQSTSPVNKYYTTSPIPHGSSTC